MSDENERLRALLQRTRQYVEYAPPHLILGQDARELLREIDSELSAAPLTVAPPREPDARDDYHEAVMLIGERLAIDMDADFNDVTKAVADWTRRASAAYPFANYVRPVVAAAPQGEATPPRDDVQWSAEYVWYRGSFYKRTDERPEASYESPEAIGFLRSLDQGET